MAAGRQQQRAKRAIVDPFCPQFCVFPMQHEQISDTPHHRPHGAGLANGLAIGGRPSAPANSPR
jgi:hypothetical protein